MTTEIYHISGFSADRSGKLLGYCHPGRPGFLTIWLRFLTVDSNSDAFTSHYWCNLLDTQTRVTMRIKVKAASDKVSFAGMFGSINTALSANNLIPKLVMRIIM